MTSPFDPRSWWFRGGSQNDDAGPSAAGDTPDGPTERPWTERWLDTTSWWNDLGTPSLLRRHSPGEMLSELIQGLARRFESRTLQLTLRGRRVRGVLESIRLLRQDPYEAQVELRELEWGPVPVRRASIRAASVQLHVSTRPRIEASNIELVARVSVDELVRWLDEKVAHWSLFISEDGELRATDDRYGVEVGLAVASRGESVDVEVRDVQWRGYSLRVPSWLRIHRTLVPQLPSGLHLVGFLRRGDEVDVHAVLDSVSESVDVGAVRAAIAKDAPITVG